MSKKRRWHIEYLPAAVADLEAILTSFRKDKPTAKAMLERFDTAVSRLADNPELGVVPKDVRFERLGYRMLILRRYMVFFVIKERTVQIRRILHGARQHGFLL